MFALMQLFEWKLVYYKSQDSFITSIFIILVKRELLPEYAFSLFDPWNRMNVDGSRHHNVM